MLTGWLLLLFAFIASHANEKLGAIAFTVLFVFIIIFLKTLKEINFATPTPVDVLSNSSILTTITFVYLAVVILSVFYALVVGLDLGLYLNTPLKIILLVFLPIIPAIVISQVKVFISYGKDSN